MLLGRRRLTSATTTSVTAVSNSAASSSSSFFFNKSSSLVSPATFLAATSRCSARFVSAGWNLSLQAPNLKTNVGKQAMEKNLIDKQLAVSQNNEIMETLKQVQSGDEVAYRKVERPWELVPQWKKRRVADLVGILKSEHRMEMELMIEKINMICDIDVHIVIVPTVGYTSTRLFAQSLFWDWQIGEPKGNGVLILLSQGDANVQCVASPVLSHYFSTVFLQAIVEKIMTPTLKEFGSPSYAVLQTCHAVCAYIFARRHDWSNKNALLPMHVRNKLRHAERMVAFGALRTSSFWAAVLSTIALVWLINRILDLYCPDCGEMMHHVVDDEYLEKFLTRGQYLEHKNECTKFHVHKCPKCPGKRIRAYAQDIYQNHKCLPCEDCEYNTMTLEKNVLKLPKKDEDGVKQFYYFCENCRVAKDLRLPLLRPLDEKPSDQWYATLLERAENPMGEKKRRKLI